MRGQPDLDAGFIVQRKFVEQIGDGFIEVQDLNAAAVMAHPHDHFIKRFDCQNVSEMRFAEIGHDAAQPRAYYGQSAQRYPAIIAPLTANFLGT